MSATELKRRWKNGDVTYGATVRLGSVWVAEVLARSGLDFVKLDLHQGMNYEHLLMPMFQAMNGTDATPFVKVPGPDPTVIGRVIDFGAEGVTVPEIDTAQEAARAADACRPFPEGTRKVGGGYRLKHLPGGARREIICIATIESATGVENAGEIAAVEGIDGIIIAVKSVALSLGLSTTSDHDIQPGVHAAAVEEVQAACRRHGIPCGMTSDGAADPRYHGFQIISLGADTSFFEHGLDLAMRRTAS